MTPSALMQVSDPAGGGNKTYTVAAPLPQKPRTVDETADERATAAAGAERPEDVATEPIWIWCATRLGGPEAPGSRSHGGGGGEARYTFADSRAQ